MQHHLESVLQEYFGYKTFRPHQLEVITSLLSGQDLFAAMPTGGGKSLCYQLPALILKGLTVVISPLVALMKDQVDNARENGISAELLNSTLGEKEIREVYGRLYNGEVQLLYISPERFALQAFIQHLKELNPVLFAVDEAHCLSEWGHDFRPDYLNLRMIRTLFPECPIGAFTATATLQVQKNIVERLQLSQPRIIRASFDRPELTYRITPKKKAVKQIISFIQEHPEDTGIVYRTSRKDVDKTSEALQQAGINALPYHAGLSPKLRSEYQEKFNRDEAQVIVATIAFGMGIDKSNIRYVIHGDLPKSLEGYYQETGRAGRDGLPSECLLLFSRGDIMKIRFILDRMEDQEERKRVERNINIMARFASVNVCRRKQILEYFDEKAPDNCGNCDICLDETETEDATTQARMFLSAIYRTKEIFGMGHIVDIVKGSDTEKIRKFRHNELPTFGVGEAHSRVYWRGLGEELISQQYVKRGGQYNSLSITSSGRQLLFGEIPFAIIKKVEKKPDIQKNLPEGDVDTELLQKLKEKRSQLASRKGVPPYIIFSDKTLLEMAHYRPRNNTEMMLINGVGATKLKRYGEDFLEVLNNSEVAFI